MSARALKAYLAIALTGVCAMVCPAETDRAFAERLVRQMTLEEKAGQLVQVTARRVKGKASEDASGHNVSLAFLDRVRRGEIGSVIGATGVPNFNALQQAAAESRMGIPLFVGHDMEHGCATVMPIPLGLSCSWNDAAWRRVGEITSIEAALKGCNMVFAPMLDIARDARWGRIAESPGQDPYLASRYAAAFVCGVQRAPSAGALRVAACLKHFVGYGAASGGRDYNEVEMCEGTLRDIYLPPFKAGIEAGALAVMPGFHAFNAVPCSVNRFLLRDVLRRDLGFDGMTLSDWGAVAECGPLGHGVTDGDVGSAARALAAGMDMEMMGGAFTNGLVRAVRQGLVSEEVLDAAVADVLVTKRRLGLFDRSRLDAPTAAKAVDSEHFLAEARQIARETIVLLKNEGRILPLKKGAKVVVLGDLAANWREMMGTWSSYFENRRNTTLIEGLTADGIDFKYEPCFTLTGRCDRVAIERVVAAADIVVATFGEYYLMNGENRSYASIALKGEQLEVARTVKICGKPLVAVLFNGRPLAIPELDELADAIVEAWNPGCCGGWAVADVLTGLWNPSGRLTTDFPRHSGQCPAYYNRTSTGRPYDPNMFFTTHYEDVPLTALYPFGRGLSYTTFAYGEPRVRDEGSNLVFSVKVTNVGNAKGIETVQLYTHPQVAMAARPIRELKGFARLTLEPGETRTAEIRLARTDLAYHVGAEKRREPGVYDWWLAPDSVSGLRRTFQ